MAGFGRKSCVRNARTFCTNIRLGNLKKTRVQFTPAFFVTDSKEYIFSAGVKTQYGRLDCRDEIQDIRLLGKLQRTWDAVT